MTYDIVRTELTTGDEKVFRGDYTYHEAQEKARELNLRATDRADDDDEDIRYRYSIRQH